MYSEMDVILIFLAIFSMFIFVCAVAAYFIFTHIKHRNREEESIDSVLLQVAVHKNNEIKIDAMEQLFSALSSIKEGGWKQKYKTQPTISFEIVAKKEDIRFYVWTPKKFQDMIEKQIHGAYPDADIAEVVKRAFHIRRKNPGFGCPDGVGDVSKEKKQSNRYQKLNPSGIPEGALPPSAIKKSLAQKCQSCPQSSG